jgi:trehalose utilization protein
MNQNRRDFLKKTALTAASGFSAKNLMFGRTEITDRTIRVVIWDERQPRQKQAYENFLGNEIAEYFRGLKGLVVQSVGLDDREQGLSEDILNNCDVLIWWGHLRHKEVLPEKGIEIVKRIVSGSLSLIALHAAHWSTPFMEAMNEVTRRKEQTKHNGGNVEIEYIVPPQQYTKVTSDVRTTPYSVHYKYPDGKEKVEVHLPYCVFPLVRNDGKPSTIKILRQKHPIVKDIPEQFEIPQTEVYGEPFHVPEPDDLIFEERWATGDWFRSGMLWSLGKGKVFYFRPGHETYPVFKQKWPLKILANTAHWMGRNMTRFS